MSCLLLHVSSTSLILSSSSSNIDLNLEYSLRDLKQIKRNFKYDVTFWYCLNDTKLNTDKSINPLKIIETLTKDNYKIWYTKNPDDEKLDQLTCAIKESKLVILGISDEFSQNEKCIQVFDLVKNIIKKNYLLIEYQFRFRNNFQETRFFSEKSAKHLLNYYV